METRQLAIIVIGVLAGLAASLILTPLFCLLRRIIYVPFFCRNLVEKAERKNHVVTATLVKTHDIMDKRGDVDFVQTGQEMGIYHYKYRGRTYKYRTISGSRMPNEITLYFLKNPARAAEDEFGLRKGNWPLYYIVIAVISMIVVVSNLTYYL